MARAGTLKRAVLGLIAAAQLSTVVTAESEVASTTLSRSTITSRPSLTASRSSASPTSTGKVHSVLVGSGGFKFTPNKLENVEVGDIVAFEFYPLDHSVARAEYGSPCVPYEDTGKDKVGFFSDVQWVRTVKDLTHWNLTINSTEPIFFYCTAKGSCKDQQMVGVINPNATQTLEEQIAAAKNSTLELAPGQPIPAEHTGTLAMPTSTPHATGASASPSGTPDKDHDHKSHGLGKGAIAGIVVGAVAFLVICAALFFFVGRTRTLKEHMERKDATVVKVPDTPGTPGTFGAGPHSPYSPNLGNPYAYAPMSPTEHQGEFTPMAGHLPPYQQTSVTDAHPSGYPSPHPGTGEKQTHHYELASPPPQQSNFVAELPASTKSPR